MRDVSGCDTARTRRNRVVSGARWALQAIGRWPGSRLNRSILPDGSGFAQAEPLHGQGVALIVGVIACVMRMTAIGRWAFVVVAVTMSVTIAPGFPMV